MPGDGGLKVLLNPAEPDAEGGAAFLTRCFSSPWTAAMYRWYLERVFAGEAPDTLLLTDDGAALAGCGLVYRQLRTTDGELHRVSIVVAACTLPSARGRGCYARVLQAAVERSTERGCTALLGFVTADNATGRGLRRLNAIALPSSYIVSRPLAAAQPTTMRVQEVSASDAWPARAAARAVASAPAAGFHYPDPACWRSQMTDRPHGVRALRIGATCRALIETVEETDRLQWLDGDARERSGAIRAVAARAAARGRQFFMYSTCPEEAAAAARLGLAARPGYMMALPLKAARASMARDWSGMGWRVQSGDRL